MEYIILNNFLEYDSICGDECSYDLSAGEKCVNEGSLCNQAP